jgi:hypothetical protein
MYIIYVPYFEDSMMSMSLTALRQQLFKVVDQVIATGIPIEIKRNGHIVKIVLDDKKSKLGNLVQHDCIVGDPEALIDLHLQQWSEESKL